MGKGQFCVPAPYRLALMTDKPLLAPRAPAPHWETKAVAGGGCGHVQT